MKRFCGAPQRSAQDQTFIVFATLICADFHLFFLDMDKYSFDAGLFDLNGNQFIML